MIPTVTVLRGADHRTRPPLPPLPPPPPAAAAAATVEVTACKPKQRDCKKPRRTRATITHNTTAKAITRAQQDSQLYNLKLDVQQLRQQVHDLVLHRQLLSARAALSFFSPQPHDAILSAAVQYFQGFSRGYRGALANPQQCALLQTLAHEQLSMGITGFGVDMLLEQWRRYTTLFRVHTTTLHSTELLTTTAATSSSSSSTDDQDDQILVKCVTTFHGVFTRDAVDAVFPSAQCEPSLLLRVLGAKLELPLVFHLYFSTSGQLMRHDAEADFLSAVCKTLDGDTQAALRFVDHARVGAESMVGPLPMERGQEDQNKSSVVIKRLVSSRGDDVEDEEEEEGEEEKYGAQSPCSPSAWAEEPTFCVEEMLTAAAAEEEEEEEEDGDDAYRQIRRVVHSAACTAQDGSRWEEHEDATMNPQQEEEQAPRQSSSSSRHSLSFLLSR